MAVIDQEITEQNNEPMSMSNVLIFKSVESFVPNEIIKTTG